MNCHAHTAASLYTGQGGTYKYYSDGYVHFVTPGTCTGAMNGLGLTGYQCAAAKVNPPKITLKLTKTNANPDATSEITTKSGYPAETVKNIKKRYKLKATFGVYETKEDARANKNRVAKIETILKEAIRSLLITMRLGPTTSASLPLRPECILTPQSKRLP